MAKAKTVELNTTTSDGKKFRSVWRNSPCDKYMVDVEVYVEGADKPVIEWSYAKIRNGIAANASLWVDQAILEARGELKSLGAVL